MAPCGPACGVASLTCSCSMHCIRYVVYERISEPASGVQTRPQIERGGKRERAVRGPRFTINDDTRSSEQYLVGRSVGGGGEGDGRRPSEVGLRVPEATKGEARRPRVTPESFLPLRYHHPLRSRGPPHSLLAPSPFPPACLPARLHAAASASRTQPAPTQITAAAAGAAAATAVCFSQT
ncbi:hypothetical protein BDZ90DRAFT_71811 [Jaminaea rosea]|uniref:Uncharacterized protein n=1 Tax=Jaminaea rosea TaxID=1569628 RepID=A0A316UKF3_9BASI|nr:hypothetical protein BDZ90DRAFT_71811 [Jaminaea rosea]PWN25278.1 hypothetical protein BDZ90DRAFT_71811 [Jaminaea rosea]